ncbi:hypothetical protein BDN71DRAFT_1431892 [Pleurotus eryngii]|uniref:Uncharacterized protein n=1 Tax=Pleurotus eryngii TaxID=5323 RepID=A0A9P5ZTK6_PLEER|nr:hypothetical protein BDN71DRAFT_1431892 [Pleurotus eryngii]
MLSHPYSVRLTIGSDALDGVLKATAADHTCALKNKWKTMTLEEHLTYTEEARSSLQDQQDNKQGGKLLNEYKMILDLSFWKLHALNCCGGIELALFISHSSQDHHYKPLTYCLSDAVASFFTFFFKESPFNLTCQMEGYILSGIDGAVRKHANGEAAKFDVPWMYYNNFNENITMKYGIKMSLQELEDLDNVWFNEQIRETEMELGASGRTNSVSNTPQPMLMELTDWPLFNPTASFQPMDVMEWPPCDPTLPLPSLPSFTFPPWAPPLFYPPDNILQATQTSLEPPPPQDIKGDSGGAAINNEWEAAGDSAG